MYLLSTDLGTKIHAVSTKLLLIITFLCPIHVTTLPSPAFDGQVAGYTVEYSNMTYVLVAGGGHCVSMQFDYCVCIKHIQQQWWLFSQLLQKWRKAFSDTCLIANVLNKRFGHHQGRKCHPDDIFQLNLCIKVAL